MGHSTADDDRHPAWALAGDSLADMVGAAVAASAWHEHVTDIHQGAISYAGECLLPALGALALRLRTDTRLELADGCVLEADPASPRFRTDLLLTRPGESRAWHIFVCHKPELSPAGELARSRLPTVSVEDLIASILNPSAEERAIDADPANWLDLTAATPVERIGGTLLRLAPRNGFTTFRPPENVPETWWPDLALNLKPASEFGLNGERQPGIGTHRGSSDPYMELRLLQTLSRAISETGLGDILPDRNAALGSTRWLQFGDRDNATRLSAGMRMVHDAGGLVTGAVIDGMDLAERRVYASLVENELGTLRTLAADLRGAGVSDAGSAFDCNDGRDMAWADLGEGSERLHVRNQSGTFILELVEDGAVRILKGGPSLTLLETLVPGADGLEPVAANGDPPSIRKVRDRNGVLLSLTSVACQFELDSEEPSPGGM
jgi:hypothetical protein